MKASVLFARFPYGNSEVPDVADWLVRTVIKAKADPRIDRVESKRYDDTPITLTRNLCLAEARAAGFDFVCMIDSDMRPDAYLETTAHRNGLDPLAQPFWDSSFDHAWEQAEAGKPCLVAAPYCGPPPCENIYVFQWANSQSDHPNVDLRLEQYTREEASRFSGIFEVAALPTGLILIDLRVLKSIDPPWFEYEYADEPFRTVKATTEDVYFTRNVSLAGRKVFCNWDAWAAHWKRKPVGKPVFLTVDKVAREYREAKERGFQSNERVIMVGEPVTVAELNGIDFSNGPVRVG